MKFKVGKTYHIISREKADLLVKRGMLSGEYPKYTKAGYTAYVDYSMLDESFSCSNGADIYNHSGKGKKDVMFAPVGRYPKATIYDWMCIEYYSKAPSLMETE